MDGVYRKFGDFYAIAPRPDDGQVQDQYGSSFDLGITENTNDVERKYAG